MSEAPEGAAEAVTEDTAAAELVAEETQAQGDEQSGDDAAAAPTEEGEVPAKPKRSVQERINEAVKAQREAEREREYWREQALRAQPQPKQDQRPAEEAEPDPNDYEHGELDARFIREHATYHAKRTYREEQAREAVERQRQSQVDTFNQAAEAVADKTPDYYEVVGDDFSKVARLCTPVMSDALLASESGPDLAYHLAKNPSEARRIAALHPLAQAMELGRLSQKLATPPAPTAKTATDAPAPMPQVRGAGGQFKPAPDTDDFAAFERTYGVKGA